ncbi:MAG: N-6 DNA methylase [Rhodospirillales bacterium]|nr:N-6 DNA methylase [Rhodospirillales bacterium]
MSVTQILQTYAQSIRDQRRANPNVSEPALAPAFQRLLDELIAQLPLPADLVVSPEYLNPGVGRPDIALTRRGAPPRAFVELKAISKPSDPTRWRQHDKRQFKRFKELGCWATCNFTEFRLFHREDERGSAVVVPERALRPDQTDARADRAIAEHDLEPFLQLIQMLLAGAGQEPAARDAPHLAALMAHSARLVRGIVRDRLAELHDNGDDRHALLQVRQEFRDVLYAHPEAGGYSARDFNELFSAAFAQTLAFGMLLVREGTGQNVDAGSWQNMPEEHPLMRTALRVLSLPEVVQDVGIGFVVMCDTVNSFAPEILVPEPNGRDPILYFYEDFLQTFDPQARERFGVYYTPVEVVQYMVGALDRALRDRLRTQGLRDRAVTILDPAAGTGTFLLAIAECVRAPAAAEAGVGMAALALQDLASRMFGFELLVGPYAVAHYRLHHTLRRAEPRDGERAEPLELPRLGVYLADTLAEPGAAAPAGPLGFVSEGIADERREANRIKAEQPILAIIGNPPYRRLEEGENRTLVGNWMDNLWDDLKEPVRNAGQGNQLNTFPELSVAFWRWAIWKLFEAENAPGRGVVAFISNRKYLTGWPYADLRQMMRRRFDHIEIIDLRGDVRRGERAGVEDDQGVFNIQVGTAITLAIADGSKAEGELADITYLDSWTEGLFRRRAKLDWLRAGAEAGALPNSVLLDRDLLDDMRPRPFLNGDLIGLNECFEFYRSGVQTKRDDFVYSPNEARLSERIAAFLAATDDEAREMFHDTRDRKWSAARAVPYDAAHVTSISYRPLDRRYLYNHTAYGDFLRPELQEVWGDNNTALYAMSGGTGSGPAVWCHGLLPDYHAFRGRGGYAFPLHDRRPNMDAPNISPELLQSLSRAYGEEVAADDVFDAILCLLSAASYTLRFAEDLEDVFPHVPFPGPPGVFQQAVQIGREIRAVETFAREPGEACRQANFVRVVTEPRGAVAEIEFDGGEIILCDDGSGRIVGISQGVWDFAVSGYRVVPRWLQGRVGLAADFALVQEFRDICARVAELIDLFDRADAVLEAAVHETLSREALGLPLQEQDANDESD